MWVRTQQQKQRSNQCEKTAPDQILTSGLLALLSLVLCCQGKSCLISSLVSESWNDGSRVPPVLQPVMVPPSLMSEGIGLTIIDTSSDPAHESEWALHLRPLPPAVSGVGPAASAASSLGAGSSSAALSSSSLSASQASKASLQADAILLVVSSDVPDSFARVESHWLPLLESLAARWGVPRKPVVLAINKSSQDGSGGSDASSARPPTRIEYDTSHSGSHNGGGGYSPTPSHPSFSHLLSSHRLSAVIACSAKYLHHLSHIFYACQLVILAPIEPLFDLHAPPPPSAASAATSSSQQQITGSGSGVGSNPGSLRFKLLTQKALLRIFRLFDADCDGLLDFSELDQMHQVNFQGKRISAQAFQALCKTLEGMNKEFVRAVPVSDTAAAAGATAAERNNNALSSNGHISSNGISGAHTKVGLTFSGLLHFHYLFLKKNRHLSHCWSMVNLFGYQLAPQGSVLAPAQAQGLAQGGLQVPGMIRGSSQQGVSSSSATGGAAAAPSSSASTATIAASTAPLPSLGSLVLKESYCSLLGAAEPFHASCNYELSAVAILFLTRLFKRYDADGDGLLCVRNPPSAIASSSSLIPDAAPSSTCSLSASTDLERMFLASPDLPFAIPSFTKFVSNAAASGSSKSAQGGSYLSLDGWLASWALLLYNYSTAPLVVPAAGAASVGTAPIVPNPDILLRYLHYLCFPVTPAVPEFAWTDPATGLAPESMLTPAPAAAPAAGAAASKPKPPTKVYLPLIQRCIHITPRTAAASDLAQSLNERIQSTDAGASPAAIRQSVADPSNLRPRTVVVHVFGSAGSGKSALIDCMLGNAPSQPFAQPVTSATVAGLHGAHGTAAAAKSDGLAASESPATPSSSAAVASGAQPRTFAARLPLAHLPSSTASLSPLLAASAADASSSSVVDPALASDPTRFLLLKEIPASSAAAILGAASYTQSSCDLLLLLYDSSSAASMQFALARLQTCFEKGLPVLLVQSKSDLLSASPNPLRDFAATDYNLQRVESFSARAFWEAMTLQQQQQHQKGNNNHALAIFERIWQAGRHKSVGSEQTALARPRSRGVKGQIVGSLSVVVVASLSAPYVLTSQSAARRASQRNRLILGSALGIACTIGAYFAAPWVLQRYGIAVPRTFWPLQQHANAVSGGKPEATWRAASADAR